jgi:hypothetical protein
MRTARRQQAPSAQTSVGVFASQLASMFGLRACWYEPFPFDSQLPRIEPGSILLPAIEPGIEWWRLNRGIELPVRSQGLTLGRFVLVPEVSTSGVALPPQARARAIEMAAAIAPRIAANVTTNRDHENAPNPSRDPA